MRSWRVLPLLGLGLCLACDIVYLLPQNDLKAEVDLELTDASGEVVTRLKLSDQTGYFSVNGEPAYQNSWPSFDEYGLVPEFVYIYFLPNFDGVQALRGGQIITPEGQWELTGHHVDLEVNWKNDRQFPFEHEGSFVGNEVNGYTLSGDFTLANPNCLASSFGYDDTNACGLAFSDAGSYDLSWSLHPEYQFCPQEVVDELIGGDLAGSVSLKKLKVGDVKLDCVESYNNRHLCGQDTRKVKVDGCEWQVVVRGGAEGYSPESVEAWVAVTATTLCETATVNLCDTWYVGTVEP